MSTELQKHTAKDLLNSPQVRKRFEDMLGKRASSFITSVLQIVANNKMLANADPHSIYHSAAVAATLDLSLNDNLGFAYIVPYNKKQADGTYRQVAQFQMGYKGFIQLAQRSGQFKSIYAAAIYKSQIVSQNPLDGYEFDFTQPADEIAGYAAKFKLLNGFEAILFMTAAEVRGHGSKYSKTFNNKAGLWNTDFDSMAKKTVLKLLLSKFAPLSIDMQKAVIVDQALINNEDGSDVTYIDNEEPEIDKEAERVVLMIEAATSVNDLEEVRNQLTTPEQVALFTDKEKELSK